MIQFVGRPGARDTSLVYFISFELIKFAVIEKSTEYEKILFFFIIMG